MANALNSISPESDQHSHSTSWRRLWPINSMKNSVAVAPKSYVSSPVESQLTRINDELDRINTLEVRIAGMKEEEGFLVEQVKRSKESYEEEKARVKAFKEAGSVDQDRGSLLIGIVYTLTGLIFVSADIIVSRLIVADAFKMPGKIEPWLFAIGLALLTIVLKAAYDRLVEAAWIERRSTRRFGWVIILASVLVVVTLFVLGAYRHEATGVAISVSHLSGLENSLDELQRLNQKLVDSPRGWWGFTLTTVLFAISGAIGLGIGLQHMRDLYQLRMKPAREESRMEKVCDRMKQDFERKEQDLMQFRKSLAELSKELELVDDSEGLKMKRNDLREQVQALQAEHYRSQVERDNPSDKIAGHLPLDSPETTDSEKPRRRRVRPFIALRRLIASDHIPDKYGYSDATSLEDNKLTSSED